MEPLQIPEVLKHGQAQESLDEEAVREKRLGPPAQAVV
jgi:hypothetical protein